ncbi:phenylalanine--tRNA ligase subunit beta [Candidatus Kaiserbacteria bacterium]|nr:phenylalanine--tRNA ligase subunit beta [Candidatus Kaiserbacteria bacterium]
MKVLHSWLQEYVGETLPDAKQVEDLLTFHTFEIEGVEEVLGETVIDIDVLPNRSSDSLSHRGVAREIATLLDTPLDHDPLATVPELATTEHIHITIADTAACQRFTLALVEGVEVQASPDWLKRRLEALGQRSINNVVDATNYVMLALGQPMHVYDADTFPKQDGKWQFGVRFATAGERVSLLAEGGAADDRTVELCGGELLVVDDSTKTPVGLAGIKGGKFAEVTTDTKNVIFEAAHFNPTVIRKTARRLNILTDASKRFENEPSRELPRYAQAEIIKIITNIAGGTFVGWVDAYPETQQPVTTEVRTKKVNALLGLMLSVEEIRRIIERTGAKVVEKAEGVLTVTAPWERNDLTIEADYIEEVGRIHGLSNVVSVVPKAVPLAEVNARQYYSEKVRQALRAEGFSEVITSSFQKKSNLQLQNALASDKSCLRGTLVENITGVLDANIAHTDLLGIPDVRVFEIGTVFEKTEGGVAERTLLTLGVRTKGGGYVPKDDAVLALGTDAVQKALGTSLNWHVERGIAECNFSTLIATLPPPDAYEPFEKGEDVTYQKVSPYPATSRDIALWVSDGTDAADVERVLNDAVGELRVRTTLFDTFEKDDRVSYAFRLVFQSKEKTLTDTEVGERCDAAIAAARERGWEVR